MKVALVLGGGGSRGIAHVGVLQVLMRERIPIDLIVGTSMGGIIGALFGLGIPPALLAERMRELQSRGLLRLTRWSSNARQHALRELLAEGLEGRRFDDLKIPAILMAVDMREGVEVPLRSGSLLKAAMATSAVPSIFPPVEINGKLLADGGVIDSLATHIAHAEGADRILAVDLYPALEQDNPWIDPVSAITGIQLPFIYRAGAPIKSPNSITSMWRAVRVMAWHIHQERLTAHPPTVLLRPEVGGYGSFDFKNFDGPYQAGIEEAERHLPALQAMFDECGERGLACG